MSQSLTEHAQTQLRMELARQELTNGDIAAALGVSEMWVSRRKRGETPITLADIERLAGVLGVPPSQFIPDTTVPTATAPQPPRPTPHPAPRPRPAAPTGPGPSPTHPPNRPNAQAAASQEPAA